MSKLLLLFFLLTAIFLFLHVKLVVIDGRSMEPTLHDRQLCVLLEGVPYHVGDVVGAIDPDELAVVKRVAALDSGGVTLLGDNLAVSVDSRKYGKLKFDRILGVVIVIPWAPSV